MFGVLLKFNTPSNEDPLTCNYFSATLHLLLSNLSLDKLLYTFSTTEDVILKRLKMPIHSRLLSAKPANFGRTD